MNVIRQVNVIRQIPTGFQFITRGSDRWDVAKVLEMSAYTRRAGLFDSTRLHCLKLVYEEPYESTESIQPGFETYAATKLTTVYTPKFDTREDLGRFCDEFQKKQQTCLQIQKLINQLVEKM